uniref:Dehydrogenase/reductase SDR family member 11 n=1 Tax=Lygus hesperus TaxID=30085 RepID=A0A0K8SMD0_LYGHE
MPAVDGKVAIVTGASSGIGAGIVKELVAAGMIVAGLARRVERVQDLAKSLEGKKGKLHAVKCDVTSVDDVKKAFDWVEKNLGPPTAVVNNAGVAKHNLISNGDLNDIKLTYDTNVLGLTACSQVAIKSMYRNNTEGTIININSVAGHCHLPFPTIGSYTASKQAVTAITDAMRNEVYLLGAKIRITSLSPGVVESEMSAGSKGDMGLSLEEDILPASDIADCILFILRAPQRMSVSEMQVQYVNECTISYAQKAAATITEEFLKETKAAVKKQ